MIVNNTGYSSPAIRYADEFATLQDAIDALPANGGKVIIPGDYDETITTAIIPKTDMILEGCGCSSILRAQTGLTRLIDLSSKTRITLRNFRLIGDGSNTVGLYFSAGSYILIDDIDVQACAKGTNGLASYCSIVNSRLSNNIAGINGAINVGSRILNNLFRDNSHEGVAINGSDGVLIGNIFHSNGFHGLVIFSDRVSILDNVASENTMHGFNVQDGSNHVLLKGNRAVDNGYGGGDYDGFYIDGDDVIVEGNEAISTAGTKQRYGINIDGQASRVIMEGNNLREFKTAAYYIDPAVTDTIIDNNRID